VRFILDFISGWNPYVSILYEHPREESSSRPKEEVLIAKLESFQSQDLAINPKPSILKNSPREEVIPPLQIPFRW
jgi:hypothetical protein